MNIVIDWRSIDSEDPTSFGTTNAYPDENSFTITSPGGITRTLLAISTYTTGSADRVTTKFIDTATELPSGLPVSGTFLPAQLLSIYNDTSPIGTWTLTMADSTANNGVILHGFTLNVADTTCGDAVVGPSDQCDDGNQSD